MKRYVSMEEISDGKLYGLNDMVKADCNGCKGCSDCCKGMGESIILDPLDIYNMTTSLKRNFQELMEKAIELHVVDGVILPNLKMKEKEDCCYFLDENGRCTIHQSRPGICRIFPLGRYYEENGFRYFLQVNECMQPHAKIKVDKWIDTPQIKENQEYIYHWHNILKRVEKIMEEEKDDQVKNQFTLFFLNTFFVKPYDVNRGFYEQYKERIQLLYSIIGDETV